MWQQRISEAEEPNVELRKKIAQMEQERKRRSMALQEWLFKQYSFLNAQGERCNLLDIFSPSYPPGGAGDCCAPKLLQAAYEASYTPLCMAEFWVGNSPADELRAEGNFYPSCRSKCLPILGHMLKGLSVETNPLAEVHDDLLKRIRVWHQEDDFLVKVATNINLAEEKLKQYGVKYEIVRRPVWGHHPHGFDDVSALLEFHQKSRM